MSEGGRRALLVIDSQSRGAREAKDYVAALETGGLTLIRREVQRARMGELIRAMRKEVDCVVIGGNDATLSAGAIALRDTHLPLGILPVGNTNELARSLGVPSDPQGSAEVILAGETRRVNLGSVNGLPFFTVASVGLTLEGARQLSRAANASMGRLRYVLAAMRAGMNTKRFSAIIRCGAVVHRVRTIQITVGNGRIYSAAGDTSEAPPDESILGVHSLEPDRRWSLLFLGGAFLSDPTVGPNVRTATSPVVEVVTRLPQPIEADGQVVTVTPARFGILPHAVSVYVPRAAPAPGLQED